MKRIIKANAMIKVDGKTWREFIDRIENLTQFKLDSAYRRRRPGENFIMLLDPDGNSYEAEITQYSDGSYELLGYNIHKVVASKKASGKKIAAKQNILASSFTEEFLQLHDDAANYGTKHDALKQVYDILNKYGDESEDVDVVFERATPKEQMKIVQLLRPESEDDSHGLYFNALHGELTDTEYGRGVLDMFNQLKEDGYIDAREWSR